MRRIAFLLLLLSALPLAADDDREVLDALVASLAPDAETVLVAEQTRVVGGIPVMANTPPQLAEGAAMMRELALRNAVAGRVPMLSAKTISAARFQQMLDDRAALGDAGAAVEVTLPAYNDDRTVAVVQYRIVKPFGRGTVRRVGSAILQRHADGWRISDRLTLMSDYGGGAARPLRVGGEVKAPVLVHRVAPHYPEDARKARAMGIVIVEALVDRQGRIVDVEILKNMPFGMGQAAVDAVRQWQFRPATMNGEPVDVIFNLTVNFKLDLPAIH